MLGFVATALGQDQSCWKNKVKQLFTKLVGVLELVHGHILMEYGSSKVFPLLVVGNDSI